jgi:hypothetical protein
MWPFKDDIESIENRLIQSILNKDDFWVSSGEYVEEVHRT